MIKLEHTKRVFLTLLMTVNVDYLLYTHIESVFPINAVFNADAKKRKGERKKRKKITISKRVYVNLF